jgi:hypothetical protein
MSLGNKIRMIVILYLPVQLFSTDIYFRTNVRNRSTFFVVGFGDASLAFLSLNYKFDKLLYVSFLLKRVKYCYYYFKEV